MIFASRNEDGIPAWVLVLIGRKTVTRRKNCPDWVAPGPLRAVQAGRGKTGKALGYVRIEGVMLDSDWMGEARGHAFMKATAKEELRLDRQTVDYSRELQSASKEEASREGFNEWKTVEAFLAKHDCENSDERYRVEFVNQPNKITTEGLRALAGWVSANRINPKREVREVAETASVLLAEWSVVPASEIEQIGGVA